MKKLLTIILLLAVCCASHAVLKERDLDRTLKVLRGELTENYQEYIDEAERRSEETQVIVSQLRETLRRCGQNALMLYSQKQNYVFDLTYACHEATEQYHEFMRQQLPFKTYLATADADISKYDSLIVTLQGIRLDMLSEEARTDRAVCLTLATSIRNTLDEGRQQVNRYVDFYEMAERRLKNLNDYANKRYGDIQTSIFMNGGQNYFTVLKNFGTKWKEAKETLADKYEPSKQQSDWDSTVILRLFAMIVFYIIVAVLLNQLVFRLMPRRFHTKEFLKKRSCIIMTTTTITFAAIMAVLQATLDQNFYMMASSLLIEYAWLLSVILISLLLRVNGDQIRSAFLIYTPLLVVGFLVIAFRIVLIPRELVNIIFPPILLLSALWQWSVIRRHNKNVPRSDMFYTYLTQAIFVISLVCSWIGYTLLAVQILIWWIMQLTCILTITCLIQYLKLYGERHGYDSKPITQSWFYLLLYKVVLPVAGVGSVMLSIYWAAGVFNMSDLCWQIFKDDFIHMVNLKVSILKVSMVICLWFFFAYVSNTILSFMRLHFQSQDPTTAASREVMGRNVIQVLVWGAWLLISLSLLDVSVYWLMALGGGLSTGVGFALKDIIENIYYGATLMAGRIKVGDWIEVDGTMGRVASISYTSTVVQSLYGEVITFQNSQLFSKNYKNLTRNHGYILAAIPFGVAYGSNLKQVIQVVEDAVNHLHHKWVDPAKKAKAVMTAMNDSSVDFKLFVWADAVKKIYVVSDVLKCIYDTLGENGIQIPFPQRDIHIKTTSNNQVLS
ncbi:MAG: mechanosensitive ion channel family protein [Prevotella sp.]|nr:mechanosensitive ion channel family protein [Prevotella sp.]